MRPTLVVAMGFGLIERLVPLGLPLAYMYREADGCSRASAEFRQHRQQALAVGQI